MSFFEQSRYFFNYVLPDIVFSNLEQINNLLSPFWWILAILVFVLIFIYLKQFRRDMQLKYELRKLDNYYLDLSRVYDTKEIEKKLIDSIKLFRAKYASIYELRGEAYILVETNISSQKGTQVAAPLRIAKREVDRFEKSGRFIVTIFTTHSKQYIILLYALREIKKDRYRGFYSLALGYYEAVVNSRKSKGSQVLTEVSKDTSMTLVKLQMDKYKFFKFFVALIMKVTKAKGAKLLTKKGESVFEYKPVKGATLQKTFYIRNTPYKLDYYDDKPLEMETIVRVGAFLDMAGGFMENIDKNSEMVSNYIDLLKFTNEAIELENIYYQDHSLIVQTVSLEVAKSLFLDEEELDNISLGAFLHDIGMVGDLLAFLDKDSVGEKEMNLIKEHPLIGSIMAEPISHIYPISDIIKYHHERYDGRGYPFGLKESQIPMSAQIVALGEFYAGLTGDRSYKKGKSHEEAIQEIKKASNKMFDSSVVEAFLEIEKSIKTKIEKIKEKRRRVAKEEESS